MGAISCLFLETVAAFMQGRVGKGQSHRRIAAMAIMARWLTARFSYRVAIRRNRFNLLISRSTRLRSR